MEDKKKYVIHIGALKQALNHGLRLKKVHGIIQFKQKEWLKIYIDMNTELRKNAENEFEKSFFKLMNNFVFRKTMENVRNHRDIKLATSEKRRKRLVSESSYHSCKKFSDHLMATEMKKTRVKMNKPLYLGMSILDISKTLMYEFWYDYVIQILIALLFILKLKIFLKIFLMMLKNGLTRLTMIKMIKDHFQQEKIKKYEVFLKMNWEEK